MTTIAARFRTSSTVRSGKRSGGSGVEIGQAQTLPWVDLNTRRSDNSYNVHNLAKDTLAILDLHSTVLVRMETLRRATLYARQDPQAAKELLTRLRARATEAPSDARGALAWFDFGYLAEAYKQWIGKGEPNPAAGVDGYGLVKRAIQERGNDPEMEFAAALITRAMAEVRRLGVACSAQPETFTGLSGLGDLTVTCFSKLSRNRGFGERLGKGENLAAVLAGMVAVAEGYPTARSAYQLARKHQVVTPVIDEVYRMLYEGKNVAQGVRDLMMRDSKAED